MKLRKRKDYNGTVRTARTDEGAPIAIIGTVEDLLSEGVFDMCDGKKDYWAVVHLDGTAEFYTNKEAAVNAIERAETRI